MNLFWSNGFSSSSLDELSEVTGMGRPSLYQAFGNKEAMYLEALSQFRLLLVEAVRRLLESPEPISGLRHFYRAAIDLYFSGHHQGRGCLFVCTAAVEAPNSPAIRQALVSVLEDLDGAFRRFFQGRSPEALAVIRAQMAASLLHSVAIRSRAGQTKESLVAMTDQAVLVLCQ